MNIEVALYIHNSCYLHHYMEAKTNSAFKKLPINSPTQLFYFTDEVSLNDALMIAT